MQGTQREEELALQTELEALAKMEQVVPATVKLGRRLCQLVDVFAREKGRAVQEVEFGDTTWHSDGKFYIPMDLKDQYAISTYKVPEKAWHEFSSLKVLDQAGFEQVCSLIFAIGQQLLPIVRHSGAIRPDLIQFERPRVLLQDGKKQIVFKATFQDYNNAATRKLGDSGHIPK